MANLLHDNHVGIQHALVGNELRLMADASALEAVAGGAGFVNASGAVSVSLANARHVHLLVDGNIDSLAFTDVPNGDEFSIFVTLVLRFDATGNHTLSGLTSVEWANGGSWSDINRAPNAENHISLWTVGSVLHGAIVRTGIIRLDPVSFTFDGNYSQLYTARQAETLDLSDVTNLEEDGTAGTGTLSFKRNGGSDLALEPQAFTDGQVLKVTMVSSTTPSSVTIPRRLT